MSNLEELAKEAYDYAHRSKNPIDSLELWLDDVISEALDQQRKEILDSVPCGKLKKEANESDFSLGFTLGTNSHIKEIQKWKDKLTKD